jgi:rhodanese-related sulfurtransferase
MAAPMEILGKHVIFMQNNKHDAVSHPINYPSDFTERIWFLCSTGVRSRKASNRLNSKSGSSLIEKSEKPQNQCVKNYSC